ncbi:cytochrome c oxidase subunit II [Benzoatithermus flavus]|uniref:Cytochrome aa3 subunit 2 n=1 Tax=Benzoatithermus flavus TaxID=3108223 RepID=A0ABU8XY94_9PROT
MKYGQPFPAAGQAFRPPGRHIFALWLLVAAGGCSGSQSALDPAGREAGDIAFLFWTMVAGGGVLWAAVAGIAVYATRLRPAEHPEWVGRGLILGGGVALPLLVLTGLLVPGLAMLPSLRTPGGPLRIAVSGEQWWWRVAYHRPGGEPVASANEIRLPRGEQVELVLTSPDVIHSFWIPSLAGKVDMIPGRTNRLVLEPTRTGTFRGACAEFCGTAHALMAFAVVVVEPAEFDAWLDREAAPAAAPSEGPAARGAELFDQLGCGGCHTIRGTRAQGIIGPDLTHIASRRSLGAGILPNDHASLVRWIAATSEVKPEVRMPAFGMLPAAELEALASYLGSLR